ncbi:hypothetical protein SSX86_006153 [Deinandra increscens subsp. villosa]|uniref:Uncharacterized protein n=1 Tax=Deinandra increscens subsp. villosa TaxID=3103831 RepID=A0AAP0DMH1_9ASTR
MHSLLCRFAVGCYEPSGAKFKTHVKTQFLSPEITYTVNLVFKRKMSNEQYIGLSYKLEGEEDRSYLFVLDKREDGWLTAELYQFTSDQTTIDLEIKFYTKWCPNLLIESMEFRPLEKVEHQVLTDDKDDMQLISDTKIAYWEQKLPNDYEEIIKLCVNDVEWKTKKELYYILCEGFLINSGEEWFSLAKDGKKCLMVQAKAVLKENEWEWKSEPETRFGQVADCISKKFGISCELGSKMLSPQTTYAAYLVYNRLPHAYTSINPPLTNTVQVVDKVLGSEAYNIFLRTPQTPVIGPNLKIKRTYNPSVRPRIKGLPKLRSDGWMEVQVHEFQTPATMRLRFSSYDMSSLAGITVQGLEFRPI